MAITILVNSDGANIEANEKSTLGITIDFTDDDDAAVAPTSATWTLTDNSGNVINGKEDVVITAPTSSEIITLSGDDLQILTVETSLETIGRRFLIEAIYTSSLGAGLPLKDSCFFVIRNLAAVAQ